MTSDAASVAADPASARDRVAITGGDRTWWGWAGVRVLAATDLTVDRSYASLDPVERVRKALAEQQAWLRGLLAEQDLAVEVRWSWAPQARTTSVYVIGRVLRGSRDESLAAANRFLARLGAAPPHVVVEPLRSDELAGILQPFEPHPSGAAEIRKRHAVARPNRPDAGVDRYWMPHPLHVAQEDWSSLLQQLTGLTQRVELSVALEPVVADARLVGDLDRVATLFSRLAREGEASSPGLYATPARLAPDTFAVDAQRVYADLARRFRGQVARMRIAVASPEPLDDGFLNVIGSSISPPDQSHGETFLTRELAGAAHTVVRPGPGDLATFSDNLAAIGVQPWAEEPVPQGFAGVAPAALLVDPVEACAAFRLPIATQGVLACFPVRRPSFAVAVDTAAAGHGFVLGEQIVGGQPSGTIEIDLDDLTMHAFVVGTTGSGKTSTVLGLLDQLWRSHGVPFLVIEPVNTSGDDYRWFLDREGFGDLVVLTAGDDTAAPLRLNPFEVPPGVRVGEHVANLLACFDAAFGLWDPLPAIYRTALERTYLETGLSLDDTGGAERAWPTIEAFCDEMEAATENLEYAGEVRSNIIAASRVRADQLRTGAARSVFDCRRSTPLDLLLSRPVVIEVGRIGAGNEQELALVIAILLNGIAEQRRSSRADRRLRHLTVVEEAHKLLRSPAEGRPDVKGDASVASARLFANLLAEIRKYGEGILIADQDPAKLVADAYKNTNLKIMHRLPDERDRQLVGASMQFDPDHVREAAALRRFHAFVHAEGFERPALVRTPNPRVGDDRAPATDDAVRQRFEVLRERHPTLAASVSPYAECDGCPAACRFRSRAAAAASTRVSQRDFRGLMDRWDPTADPGTKDAWWGQLAVQLGTLVAPEASDPDGRAAFEACAFLHLLKGRYKRGRSAWIREWRRRSTAGQQAGRQLTQG